MRSAGLLALLMDLESLTELVSIGTLFVFFAISAAVLWRRHYDPGQSAMGLAWRLIAICLLASGRDAHTSWQCFVAVVIAKKLVSECRVLA